VFISILYLPHHVSAQTGLTNNLAEDNNIIIGPTFKKSYVKFGINFIDNNASKTPFIYNDEFNRFKNAFTLGLSREVGEHAHLALTLNTNSLEVLGEDRLFFNTTVLYNYDILPFLFGRSNVFNLYLGAGTGFYTLQNEKGNMLVVYNGTLDIWFSKGLGLSLQHQGNVGVLNLENDRVNNFNQVIFGIKMKI
jgi:hypothetical protein